MKIIPHRIVRRIKHLFVNIKQQRQKKKMQKGGYLFRSPQMHSLFFLPYFDVDLIQKHIYETGTYFETDELTFICQKWHDGEIGKAIKGASIIDVGSNIGNHTLYYLNECGVNHVYCFEPIPDTYEILTRNIAINGLPKKTTLYCMAVGKKKGHARIGQYDIENIGMTSLIEDNSGEFEVVPLDEIVFPTHVKLIKIDVEGFELDVLYGMKETMKKHLPYITIELRDQFLPEADAILHEVGYNREIIKSYSQYQYSDYLLFPFRPQSQ